MCCWFHDNRSLFVASLLFSAALGYFARLPLWHTDLWGHLSFGRLIWESGELPRHEPFLLLADDRHLIDTAWLSQLILYATESRFGVGGLQVGFGVLIAVMCAVFFFTAYRLTNHLLASVVGTGLLLWLEWNQIEIIRPQLAGTALYVILLCRYQFPLRRELFAWLPLTMILWANLHGSFIMGVGLTGAFFLAMVIDAIRSQQSLVRAIKSPGILFAGLLLSAVVLAPLLNPYGVGLYRDVLTFSNNPNLYDLVEWQPLTLKMRQGRSVLVVSLMLVFLWQRNGRVISTFHLLLLLVLGIATLLNSRMIVWWAPVAAMEALRQLEVFWGEWCRANGNTVKDPTRFLWRGISLLVVITTLGVTIGNRTTSRAGNAIEDGRIHEALRRAVSRQTPLELSAFLHEKLLQDKRAGRDQPYRLLNSMVWGDFLIWSLPEGQPVFVYSHVHLIPRDIWEDYRKLMRLRAGWLTQLDQREIDLIVLDGHRHRAACAGLRASSHWIEIYKDQLGAIFQRTEPFRNNQ